MIKHTLIAALAGTILFGGNAIAQTHWITPGSGQYVDAANWSAGVPSILSDAVFDQDLAYTVTIPAGPNRIVRTFTVEQGDVTLDLGNIFYQIWNDDVSNTLDFGVGSVPGQTGRLTLQNGTVFMRQSNLEANFTTEIGSGVGAVGELVVTGANTLLDERVPIIGVNGGTGTLRIEGGAEFEGSARMGYDPGATGTLILDGPGTLGTIGGLWVGDGDNSTGYLTVTNGATVKMPSYIYLGNTRGGVGTANISGSGTSVGPRDGGSFTGIRAYGSGTGSVLNVFDNATINSVRLQIFGETIDVGGTINISDDAFVWTEETEVGTRGVLNISSGAELRSWETVLDLYTAEPYRDGELDICNGGTVNLNGGRLSADVMGANPGCGDAGYAPGAFIMTAGELSANEYNGHLFVQGGTLDPGDDRGALAVNGDYTQGSAANLRVNVKGTYPGLQFNVMNITGTATLDGKVEVLLDPSYAVPAGTTFAIVNADTIVGGFAQIGNPCISDTLYWTVNYNFDPAGTDTTSLEVAQAPSGTVCSGGITVVGVDVDPWSAANEVRPESTDSIVVAVLGSNTVSGDPIDFDVQQIDQNTLRFGPNGAEIISLEPLFGDYDADSNQDAAFVFATPDTGIACDDTDAVMTGETYAGELFSGTSTIVTVDCTSNSCHE